MKLIFTSYTCKSSPPDKFESYKSLDLCCDPLGVLAASTEEIEVCISVETCVELFELLTSP